MGMWPTKMFEYIAGCFVLLFSSQSFFHVIVLSLPLCMRILSFQWNLNAEVTVEKILQRSGQKRTAFRLTRLFLNLIKRQSCGFGRSMEINFIERVSIYFSSFYIDIEANTVSWVLSRKYSVLYASSRTLKFVYLSWIYLSQCLSRIDSLCLMNKLPAKRDWPRRFKQPPE